jgi:hypothetical protein
MACINVHIERTDRVEAAVGRTDRVEASISMICTPIPYLRVEPRIVWVTDLYEREINIESNTNWEIK